MSIVLYFFGVLSVSLIAAAESIQVMKDCADLVNELYREEAEIQKSCTSKNRPSSVHPVVCSTIVEAHEVHNFSVRGAISSTDTALAIASAKLWESFKTAREFGY